jgi:hypothetical protein
MAVRSRSGSAIFDRREIRINPRRELNARWDDQPLCGGAVSKLAARAATSCQYMLLLLVGRLVTFLHDVGRDIPRTW